MTERDPGATARTARLSMAAALAALGALALGHALQYGSVVDDAFIAFRFAENLRDGHGLVFNPGERVEGYTDFLWVLLIAGGSWLGAASETVARVLGLTSVAVLPALLWPMGRRLGLGRVAALLPGAVVAASTSLALWAGAGLETTFYAALLTAGLALLVAEAGRPSRVPLWGLILALATLTRPEGAGVFALALLWVALVLRQRRLAAWGLLLFAPVVGAHLLFRVLYYGQWLPNTWYAKAPGGLESAAEGWLYLKGFLLAHGLGWSLPALLGVALLPEDRDWRLPTMLLTVVTGACAYVVWVGGDFLPAWRFLAPYLPLLALLICAGGYWAGAALAPQLPRPVRGHAPLLAAAVCALAMGVPSLVMVREQSAEAYGGMQIDADTNDRFGRWLDRTLPAEAFVAGSAMGRIPYLTGRRTLDMLGLTDAHVAHQGRTASTGARAHRRMAPEYVLASRPDVVLIERCERELSGSFVPEEDLTSAFLRERVTRRWNMWPAIKALFADKTFLRDFAPRHAEVKQRGFCYYMQRDDTLARLEQAQRAKPEDPDTLERLARRYRLQGLTDEATATLSKVIAARPDRPLLRLELAAWYREGQQPEKAVAQARPLLTGAPTQGQARPDPWVVRAHWEVGAALFQARQFQEAQAMLTRYVQLAPTDRRAVEARLALEQLRVLEGHSHSAPPPSPGGQGGSGAH